MGGDRDSAVTARPRTAHHRLHSNLHLIFRPMTVLVVGSVALDSVETPFGKADDVLGGSGTFFSASASHLDARAARRRRRQRLPVEKLEPLRARGVDLAGLEQASGESFRWRGRYRHDLNSAETLETRLGVFSHFRPKIPEQFRERAVRLPRQHRSAAAARRAASRWRSPKLVACDTMNFWIESRRADLLALLEHVDLVTLNDGEARQLTEELEPREGGALDHGARPEASWSSRRASTARSCSREHSIFFAPAYPLEDVFDPTGAGDSFAGGFMGYLARTGDLSDENLRRAVVYGSAMGSFAVERSPSQRLLEIDRARHRRRVSRSSASSSPSKRRSWRERRATARLSRARASTSTPPTTPSIASRRSSNRRSRAGARGAFGGFGGMFRMPADCAAPLLVSSADGVGTKIKRRHRGEPARHGGPRPREPLRERHPRAGRRPLFFLDYVAVRRARARGRWRRSCAASPRGAARTAAR